MFMFLYSTRCITALKIGRPSFAFKTRIEPMFPTFQEEGESSLELPKYIVETNKFAISFVKDILGVIYGDRHYARFAALETIARVPYFSCKSNQQLFHWTVKRLMSHFSIS